MRALVVFCVVVGVTAVGAGCPPEEKPPTPDPCPFGAVLDDDDACVFAWEDGECAGVDAGACVVGSPVVCNGADVPGYDCVACGCSGTDACVGEGDISVCESADVREAERDDEFVDDGLEDDEDYVAVFRAVFDDADAFTADEWIARLRERRAEDPRRSNVAVGADLSAAALADVVPGLFDGGFGNVKAGGSCADLDKRVLEDAEDGTVVVGAVDSVSEATCLFPGTFARCAPPSLTLCAEAKGSAVEGLVVVGQATIDAAQYALLRNATRVNREVWQVQIEQAIALFDEVFLQPPASRFFVDDVGREVRFSVDANDDRLVWALVQPNGGPSILQAFRLMVDDATVQAFLLRHDITPAQCTFALTVPDDAPAVVGVDCDKNGASISGVVVPSQSDLSQLVLSDP